MRFKVTVETAKVKREPKVKKEPSEPKVPKVKKEKKEANGEPQSLADRMKKKRKSTPDKRKPKKNPWETDSDEDDDISDFSGVSDEDSDGDFRPDTKKAKTNTNGAVVKREPELSLGKPKILNKCTYYYHCPKMTDSCRNRLPRMEMICRNFYCWIKLIEIKKAKPKRLFSWISDLRL